MLLDPTSDTYDPSVAEEIQMQLNILTSTKYPARVSVVCSRRCCLLRPYGTPRAAVRDGSLTLFSVGLRACVRLADDRPDAMPRTGLET